MLTCIKWKSINCIRSPMQQSSVFIAKMDLDDSGTIVDFYLFHNKIKTSRFSWNTTRIAGVSIKSDDKKLRTPLQMACFTR